MMRIVVAAGLGLLISTLPGHAALPPQYQRLAEIRAILDDSGVAQLFDVAHPIDKIEYVSPDLYRVSSGTCSMDVAIAPDPAWKPKPNWVGPRHFIVVPGKLVCK